MKNNHREFIGLTAYIDLFNHEQYFYSSYSAISLITVRKN